VHLLNGQPRLCALRQEDMKKQTSGLNLGKARLQKAHTLFGFIGRISLIFNQKDRFLDFSVEFMYGFCDLQYS